MILKIDRSIVNGGQYHKNSCHRGGQEFNDLIEVELD